MHLVKLACEMPDRLGISLTLWDCKELARTLESDGIVETISAETVRRILNNHHLKPWRRHMWLGAKTHIPHPSGWAGGILAVKILLEINVLLMVSEDG